ncbi:MAG: hypothetical protein KDE56_34055 [Anaerolineales bacterium]|nr:hypothetical protein [Anaerolineales bacterium]
MCRRSSARWAKRSAEEAWVVADMRGVYWGQAGGWRLEARLRAAGGGLRGRRTDAGAGGRMTDDG